MKSGKESLMFQHFQAQHVYSKKKANESRPRLRVFARNVRIYRTFWVMIVEWKKSPDFLQKIAELLNNCRFSPNLTKNP